jgi:hypothetical protein
MTTIERLRNHAQHLRRNSTPLATLVPLLNQAADELAAMTERKDGAYLERNRVVAALAKCFPSGIARTAIEGWSEDWHGCVYIDLPTGQVSWHYHDSQAYLFECLPPYAKPWDGHDTEEKYRRVAALLPRELPELATQAEINAAWNRYGADSGGNIEFDMQPIVSRGDEGAWVQAWLWVANGEAA